MPVLSAADFANLSLIDSRALQVKLARATVVPSDAVPADVVTMNSRVLYSDETAGSHERVRIVYPDNANHAVRALSVLHPIALALLGLSVGQSAEARVPDGGVHIVRVEAVLSQPEYQLRRWLVIGCGDD